MQRQSQFFGILFFTLGVFLTSNASSFSLRNTLLTDHPEANTFIEHMVQKHHFDRDELTRLLTQAKIKQNISDTMQKPYEALPWYRYKKSFLTPKHIQDGLQYWKEHEADLERAQNQYGVPPEVVVAIIGVETRYGKNKGSHNVLDALVTLAFYYPKRAEFFRSELEEFLLLVKEQHLDPKSLVGSYAGAMGEPQFMPSSYRNFAVDFSHSGKSDIIGNTVDAIGSVANYFKAHGWKTGEAFALPSTIKRNGYKTQTLDKFNPIPTNRLSELRALGININPNVTPLMLDPKTSVALIALEDETGPTYWLGLNNFYVITRYNHSNHYAMAVYQLSEILKTHCRQSGLI